MPRRVVVGCHGSAMVPSSALRCTAPDPQPVRDFIKTSEGHTAKLTCEQRGRFIATCWTAQMYKHFEDPKPGCVADLPEWQ